MNITTRQLIDAYPELFTYRQIDYWIRQAYIDTLDPLPGSGHQRALTPTQTHIAVVMGVLVHAGLDPAIAARIVRTNDPSRSPSEIAPGVYVIVWPPRRDPTGDLPDLEPHEVNSSPNGAGQSQP